MVAVQQAQYVITAVRYYRNHQGYDERKHIIGVDVRTETGTTLSAPARWTRAQVVASIRRGSTFVTSLQLKNEQWYEGDEVRAVQIDGLDYIRTDRTSTPDDNLGTLPEF